MYAYNICQSYTIAFIDSECFEFSRIGRKSITDLILVSKLWKYVAE